MMKIFLRRMVLLPRDSGNDLRFSQNGCDTSRFREVLSFCFLKKNRLETSLISICFKQKWKRDRVLCPIYCHLHIKTVLEPFPCLRQSSYPQNKQTRAALHKECKCLHFFMCVIVPFSNGSHIAHCIIFSCSHYCLIFQTPLIIKRKDGIHLGFEPPTPNT